MKAWIPLYCLLAGSCDATTGALLLAAPAAVYSLLGLTPLPSPAVYASFVGAFVLAVGLAYLYPFLLAKEDRERRFAVVFEVTAISRLAVATFLTVAIFSGAMHVLWSLVLFTDLSLAVFQIAYLRRLADPHPPNPPLQVDLERGEPEGRELVPAPPLQVHLERGLGGEDPILRTGGGT